MSNSGINKNIDNIIAVLNNKYDTSRGVETEVTSNEARLTAEAAVKAAQAAETVATAASTLINTALPQKADIDDVLLNSGGSVNGNVVVNGNLSVTGSINATIEGTTSNATRAIQDGDGNVITSTYLKKTENATSANKAQYIEKLSLADGNYSDVVRVTSGSTAGNNRVGTIRIQNNDGNNEIIIGVHDEQNSAPAGLTIKNTNGTLTSTLPGTLEVNTFKGSLTGNAATATKLAASKTIAISGGATGTATSFDGSGNITIPVTALDMSKASAGTLAVARGGTGLTASPSMLTNLASTTAANVLAASPRPGVTGVLPVANGGTGSSTKNFVDLSSAQTISGTKTFTNTVKASLGEFANFVATNGGYGFQIRNDGESTWFLLTDKNNENGQWSNTLQYGHPIRIVNSTGEVYINNQTIAQKASITTTYVNGTSGYRIWSDGFIEQYGLVTWTNNGTTGTTVTLHKAFKNTNYNIQMTLKREDETDQHWGSVAALSTTSFKILVRWMSTAHKFYWYACGY